MPDTWPFDINAVKLGKLAPQRDRRTLKLSRYLDFSKLSPAPLTCDWFTKVPQWGMLKNDIYGDCVPAGAGHLIESWSADNGAEATITDTDVVSAYSAVTGFNPNNPASDQGTNMLAFLNWWRQVGMAGHRISAYVTIDIANDLELVYGSWLFGGLYLGINMPNSAKVQPALWDVPASGAVGDGAPGSWGGHCVPTGGYTAPTVGTAPLISWGQKLDMTRTFWKVYVEEAYAVLSPDWADGTKVAPSGFAYQDLLSDLQAITGGPLPTPSPAPTPPKPRAAAPILDWAKTYYAPVVAAEDETHILAGAQAIVSWSTQIQADLAVKS